ncbi:MFS transporter [Sphingomonas morindae]|uniref:MFS transporter n=1 Tax=Sphingomonas morindae TaxID=1541170 RepID=A0ABY4XA12_9SPHN|nr:MFS transporter [Sphingomonas morindae]USI73812.1 MFS transporter [Sphingomonas morindae]
MIALLARRRFGPLFVTQLLGAFNDNLFRSAMLFLVTYGVLRDRPAAAALVASLAGGLFILPFLLFSSLSGETADRYDKARIARWVKAAELALVGLAGLALYRASLPLLCLTLFGFGAHSSLFGPVKYALLPQHLRPDELVGGTALVEAGTFLAILAGQMLGGLVHREAALALLLATALVGLMAARRIPPAPPPGAAPPPDRNLARGTARILRHALATPRLRHAVLGISWFFALGAALTQQFPPLAARLGGRPGVAILFFALFSIGVALGALGVSRWMGGAVRTRAAAPAALALALLTAGLGLATRHPPAAAPLDALSFVATPGGALVAGLLLLLAVAGGVYIVPLYATLQTAGAAAARARDVAANNVANALAMVLVTLVSVAVLPRLGQPGLMLTLGAIGLAACASARRL